MAVPEMLTKPLWPELRPQELDNPGAIKVVFPRVYTTDQAERITRFISKHAPACRVDVCSVKDYIKSTYMLTICIGSPAVEAVLGRKVDPYSNRRGYAWDRGWPVTWVPDSQTAKQNKFAMAAFTEDLQWALTTPFPQRDHDAEYHVIECPGDTHAALKKMREAKWAAYDFETAGAMYSEYFECIMMAATTDTGYTYVWDINAIRDSRIWNPVLTWLSNQHSKKVGHNIKYDMMAPHAHFRTVVRGVHSDTQLKRKLLLADANSGLELCSDLVGLGGYKQHFGESLKLAKQACTNARSTITRAITAGKEPEFPEDPALAFICKRRDLKPDAVAYGLVPPADLEIYCARDAYTTAMLEHRLDEELRQDEGLSQIWDKVVLPAIPALAAMEQHGIHVDTDALDSFAKFVDEKQEQMRLKLEERGLANPNAPHLVAKFLFEDLGLRCWKRTPTGAPSTDAGVLKSLRKEHEAVGEILEYKRLGKLAQAYGDSLPLHVTQHSRIHPSFRIDGTRTGRMSCANPGLHQIPRSGSIEGKMLKNTFNASKGHYLVQLDYSQLEYRVAAMLSQDPKMIQLFVDGKDFHQGTAELLAPFFGVTCDNVTKEHRNIAKTFNFGLLYGMTDKGLADRLLCTEEEATKIRRAILGQFKGLAEWIAQREREVRENGEVRTWWNEKDARRRPLWDIAGPVRWKAFKARNAAVNTPVQGTASDFCLASIGRIHNAIECEQFTGKLVLTVHDSIVLEVPEAQLRLASSAAKIIMEAWPSMGVPLRVDVEYGKRWGELEELCL